MLHHYPTLCLTETPTLSKLLLPSPLSESGTTLDKEGADIAADDSIEDEGDEIMSEVCIEHLKKFVVKMNFIVVM